MTKAVKEFLLDSGTGEVNVEYSDNTTTKYNLANAVTATQSAQGDGYGGPGVVIPGLDGADIVPKLSGVTLPALTPASAMAFGRVAIPDESLLIVAGSPLDYSGMRPTATPAGSKGRVTASGAKLVENGVEVRFNVASWAPDLTYAPIPSDRAQISAAAVNLARKGYNAVRLHGVENWLMAGIDGAAIFNAERLDLFDFFLAELKTNGVYWVPNVQSYNLFVDMDGVNNRFNYTADTSAKPRIYTEQNIRDNWLAGIGALLNRVNKYTGINMLQDPALLMLSVYNEASTTFCASVAWPNVWLTRTDGATAAAKTWGEWLADPTKSHGYADVAALNTAWGTAHASIAVAAAVAVPAFNTSFPATRQAVDAIKYAEYLEDDMAAWYSTALTTLGYTGLSFWSEIYQTLLEARGYGKYAGINQVAAQHNYTTVISDGIANGSFQKIGNNGPIWEYENAALMPNVMANGRPFVASEYGWPAWCKYMAQFPVLAALARSHDCTYMTHFAQGDVFAQNYYNDTSAHGSRLRRIEPYHNPGNPTQDFVRHALNAIFLRGDVVPMDVIKRKQLILNDRHWGVNPVNAARPSRAMFTLLQPLYFNAALRRTGLDWTDDTTDDTLAAVENLKSFATIVSDAVAAGAIAANHPTAVSTAANSGSIASVALSGSVGGLTASGAAPVLELTGNTLAVGDVLFVTNLTGSGGTWPGTGVRTSPQTVTAKGTGNYVQVALNLSAASGSMTAGTWSEGLNVMANATQEVFWSRRNKTAGINTAKTVMLSHTGATLPITLGNVRIDALTTDASLLITSLDNLPIGQSRKLLIALAGDNQNSGMQFTDASRKTIAAGGGGEYPIQASDVSTTFRVTQTAYGHPRVTPLKRDGSPKSSPRHALVDATGFVVSVRSADSLAWQWLLEI